MRRAALTRRGLLACAGTMVAATGARADDAPPPPPPPLAIGVLTDQTGIGASVSGPPLVRAVAMAVQDAGALPDGRALLEVTESYRLRPDDAVAAARRWFDQGVQVIVDVPGSAAAAAVQQLARTRDRTMLITGSVNPALTGRECSPLASSWAIDSTSMTTALVGAMARRGVTTWFLVAPDTVLGQSVQADAARAVAAAGGVVLGQTRHPPELTDFSYIVTQAKASGARAVGLCDITQGLTAQLGQFRGGGLFDDGRSIVAFLAAITDIHAAGASAAHGLILASPFYWNQNDQTRSFANRFIVTTQQMPDAAHAGAYAAVLHYVRAFLTVNAEDASLINQEMRRLPVYYFGRYALLRVDGRLAIDLSLLRVKQQQAMRGDWDHYESIGTIPASEIYRPVNQTGCAIGP